MFYDERRTVPETVGDLRSEYAADLAAAVESVGVDEAVEETDLDRATIEAIAGVNQGNDFPDLSLQSAAAVQALADDTPNAETIVEIGCDHLLLGMSTAVLDVDTLASQLEIDVTPKEVQQKLERRAPMSFEEYTAIQHVIVGRQ